MNELPAAAVAAMILSGFIVAWVLRRLRPEMPLLRRSAYVVGLGIVLGGVLYGMAMER